MGKSGKRMTKELRSVLPEPGPGQEIVLVRANRGGGFLEVQTRAGDVCLARLPGKFKDVMFVRIGGFIIVEMLSVAPAEKVRASVVAVLSADHVKELRKKDYWPKEFAELRSEAGAAGPVATATATATAVPRPKAEAGDADDSDREEDDDDDDDRFAVRNLNRRSAAVPARDSSSSSGGGSDSEEED